MNQCAQICFFLRYQAPLWYESGFSPTSHSTLIILKRVLGVMMLPDTVSCSLQSLPLFLKPPPLCPQVPQIWVWRQLAQTPPPPAPTVTVREAAAAELRLSSALRRSRRWGSSSQDTGSPPPSCSARRMSWRTWSCSRTESEPKRGETFPGLSISVARRHTYSIWADLHTKTQVYTSDTAVHRGSCRYGIFTYSHMFMYSDGTEHITGWNVYLCIWFPLTLVPCHL